MIRFRNEGSTRVRRVERKPVVSTPTKGAPNRTQGEHAEQSVERVSLCRFELDACATGTSVAHPEHVRQPGGPIPICCIHLVLSRAGPRAEPRIRANHSTGTVHLRILTGLAESWCQTHARGCLLHGSSALQRHTEGDLTYWVVCSHGAGRPNAASKLCRSEVGGSLRPGPDGGVIRRREVCAGCRVVSGKVLSKTRSAVLNRNLICPGESGGIRLAHRRKVNVAVLPCG